jgi:hypothetical protein
VCTFFGKDKNQHQHRYHLLLLFASDHAKTDDENDQVDINQIGCSSMVIFHERSSGVGIDFNLGQFQRCLVNRLTSWLPHV